LKKKFLTNLALLLFLNLLVKPFWVFGIDRGVQNAVGSSEYGLYFSLLNFSFLLNVLLDLGMTQFTTRSIAQHPVLISRYFSQVMSVRLILGLAYAGLTLIAGLILHYSARQFFILGFLVLNQFLLSLVLYLRANLSGLLLLTTDSLVSVLDRALMILFCSVLLWGNFTRHPLHIEWFVYAQTLAYLVTAIVVLAIVSSKLEYFRMSLRRGRVMILLRQSFPFAMLVLLMSIYNKADAVMLERILPDGKVQAGIYAQSFRILDAFAMFAFLFAGLLLPIFARMVASRQSVQSMVTLSWSALMLPVVTIVIASICYRREIMLLLYHEPATVSYKIFPMLMVSLLAISTSYIFGTLLTAHGNLRLMIGIAGAGMFVNILLNAILIPGMQALGSAWANVVTQGFMAICQVVAAVWLLSFKINVKYMARALLFVTGVLLAGWCSKHFISPWMNGFLVIMLAGMTLGLLTGMIRIREWKLILLGEERESM
jgi:O-antigen/teichoic acid export membrane protein